MQLEGNLKQFSLSELLSMIVSTLVTGVLEIGNPVAVGQIFCRNGQMYHAALGTLRGMPAIERMLELDDARFLFVNGATAHETSLWGDPWHMIGTLMRYQRLLQQVHAQIPSLHCVPALRAEGVRTRMQVPVHVWPIIAASDGNRSVRAVAAYIGYDLHDVARMINQLAKAGLMSVRAPAAQPTIQTIPLQRHERLVA